MRIFSFTMVLLLIISLCSCSSPVTETAGDQKVTLALNWLPEAEHGGFYAALLNGDYKKEGLEVEILPGGPDSPVIQRVATGRVDFGISNADRILLGRAQQAPVVGVFAPLQHSPRCIVVHKSSGIESFDQLKNVTLAMSDAPAFSHYLREKLPLEGVKIVRSTGSLSQFLQDPAFAQQGYVFSEPIVAQKQGIETNSLLLSELGFDPYSSVLIVSEKTLSEQPELVEKFVRASMAGWKTYLENSDTVHEYIQTINPEMPRDVLDGGMEALRKLCRNADGEFTGEMDPERWKTLSSQMEELKLIETGLYKKAYVNLSGPSE
ncbi:ABC transporter substrate-binding protein [Rubinisphaera italica]|uniref:Putative thiamine biosynthesis protein n=1 Tax=Rubinisphaera italica TaxID=2527969 RepID=A0A5C5XDH6_9PLAN|nr:ABC transporter substrate-binding protein [Rubinisphaera italica]TWT59972.1 putative thiamine biosynthesis protein [Rubinisphaera italica]